MTHLGVVSVIVLATLSVALSGCLDSISGTVEVPRPRAGSTYTYRSADGVELEASIHGTGERLDGHLQRHPVVRIQWTLKHDFRFGTRSGPWHYEEAVEPSTGWIVSQTMLCGEVAQFGSDEPECVDDRARLLLSAGGWPGAFGSGPLWGETLSDDPEVPVRPMTAEVRAIPYVTKPADTERGRCVEVQAESPFDASANPNIRVSYLSVISGPWTMCPGLALPASFETVNGTRFVLSSAERGQQASSSGPASGAWRQSEPAVPLENWAPPFLVQSPDASNFTIREAHREAQRQSPEYEEFFRNHPNAILIESAYERSFQSSSPLGTEDRYKQRLIVVGGGGDSISIQLEKTVQERAGMTSVQYAIEDIEQNVRSHHPTIDSLKDGQVSPSAALQVLDRLVQPPRKEAWRLKNAVHLARITPIERAVDLDGYTVDAFYDQPDPPQGGSGPQVEFPYRAAVDGPSGSILWIDLDRGRLPLRDAPS